MKAYMQKFAQSLMLPISILPVAGLLLGIASFIDPVQLVKEQRC